MTVTATSTPKSSATPSAASPAETSERGDLKGLKSKQKDSLMNPELPVMTAGAATP